MFGPREERTREKVRFEHDPRAWPVNKSGRSYGMGHNVQHVRKVEAPAASVKVYDGELDEHQLRQQEFLAVSN